MKNSRRGFTPGPWYAYAHPDVNFRNPHYSIVTSPNYDPFNPASVEQVIAGIWSGTPEDKANADLMAAAPQLLQALENADKLITQLMPGIKAIVLQDYGFLNETLLQITATIQKAKGEN